MTTTYDPQHPAYLDEADVRTELTRVFDICGDCRLCTNFCGSFPSLFDMIDGSTGPQPIASRQHNLGAGGLTPAQQDLVVDECFQCKLCVAACPYSLEPPEVRIDFPRLMLRTQAMRRSNGQHRLQRGTATRVLAHTDLVGRICTHVPSVSNRLVDARPGSLVRKLLGRATGVSTTQRMPRFARQRFSAWFGNRAARFPTRLGGDGRAAVALYPTCVVEYRETSVGRDLVDVYERNGIVCTVANAGCCGAPWLHAGYVKKFTKVATENVGKLAAEVRSGRQVVVLQPMCGYVLKQDYPIYVGGADAALVAAHTFDASEYLVRLHPGNETPLDANVARSAVPTVIYRPSSHLLAQHIGTPGGDLIALTGARVLVAADSPGDLGWWGVRAGNEQASAAVTDRLERAIGRAGTGADGEVVAVVAGDCLFTNTSFAECAGTEVLHPFEVVARAYQAADEPLDDL